MLPVIKNVLLGISLAAPVGAVSIESIKQGLTKGFRASLTIWLGAATSDTLSLLIASFGLTHFIKIPAVKIAIWLLGSIILIFMGLQSVYNSKKEDILGVNSTNLEKNAFTLGFVLAIANPMSIIWWVSVFGAVLSESGQMNFSLTQFAGNLAIIVGVLVWSLIIATASSLGKKFMTEPRLRIASIIAGLSLSGFGIYYGYQALLTIRELF